MHAGSVRSGLLTHKLYNTPTVPLLPALRALLRQWRSPPPPHSKLPSAHIPPHPLKHWEPGHAIPAELKVLESDHSAHWGWGLPLLVAEPRATAELYATAQPAAQGPQSPPIAPLPCLMPNHQRLVIQEGLDLQQVMRAPTGWKGGGGKRVCGGRGGG